MSGYSYSNISENIQLLNFISVLYPANIYNSFPVAVFWIAIGKCFADRDNDFNVKRCGIFLGISSCMLCIENALIELHNFGKTNDCYFMLPLVCICIFILLLNCNIKAKHAREMRKFSTIIFCSHKSIAVIVLAVAKRLGLGILTNSAFVTYILTLCVCGIMCFVISRVENIKGFKWTKIFY